MKGRVNITEKGVVSLMVTIMMMMVISLIVLGFAQISRREQRQSLDRQLSTQAFLAAESGINDARSAMETALQKGQSVPDKTECDNSGVGGAGNPFNALAVKGNVIDAANNVSYTCLLVNTKLKDIHQVVTYDGSSSTIPLHPIGGTITTLHITWAVADETVKPNVFQCDPDVQPFSAVGVGPGTWTCAYGVFRMDMVPTDPAFLNRNTLLSQQRATFFYPTRVNANQKISYGSMKGRVQPMKCDNKNCKVDITNISGSTTYALRLSSFYNDGVVDITADGPGGPLKLADAQAQIDSTGKAQDVLRRVQVRLSLAMINKNPNYALQTGSSICKRFMIMQNNFAQGSTTVDDDTNPMCKPSFSP